MSPKLKNPNGTRRKLGEVKICSSISLDDFFWELDRLVREKEAKEAKRRNCHCWPELPPDLIHSVLERLNIAELKRAKSICSAWLSASRKCAPKSQTPWLLIFPEDHRINRCKFFNPEEKDNLYTSQDLGVGFAESVCVATFESWLLLCDPLFNLYIVNLLTAQRIYLPPVESQRGEIKLERLEDDKFRATSVYKTVITNGFEINSALFWIDEETKDYVVIFSLRISEWDYQTQYSIICKKGSDFWRQMPSECSPCLDMVYKNQKLYVYCCGGAVKIFDLSGEVPWRVLEADDVYVQSFSSSVCYFQPLSKTKIVVTVSGDVLMVTVVMTRFKTWSFGVYKMCRFMKHWMKIDCLDGEAIVLDLGVTLSSEIEGISQNSIYFSGFGKYENDVFIFDLKTEKVERPYQSVCSLLQYSPAARWFLPGFRRKCLR